MTTLSVSPLRPSQLRQSALEISHPFVSHYAMKWRRKQLFLDLTSEAKGNGLAQPESLSWLVSRLQRSPIYRVNLTPCLPESDLAIWADACAEAGKSVHLRIQNTADLPKKKTKRLWWLKRATDWLAAALLVLFLTPLMLVFAVLIWLESPGSVLFCQWRVGERGKLFRIFKFRTMIVGAESLHHEVMAEQSGLHKCENDPRVTQLGHWMRKFSLDELPQLFNVLRGEMSLVGPRPWALYDAVRIDPKMRQRLNALPGITGIWQVTTRSHMRDINTVNQLDMRYLSHWSLLQDLKILLLTVPKVISGYGAY